MTLLEQCQKWFEAGEVDKIEEAIMNLSEREMKPELISELGRVWIYRSALGEDEEECCKKALEILEPLEPNLWDNHNYQYRMGMAYHGIGDYENAKLHFEKALKLRPNDEDTIEMIEMCERVMNGPELEDWEMFSIMRGIYPKGQADFSETALKERLDSLDDAKCVELEYSKEENSASFKINYKGDEYEFYVCLDVFESDIMLELQRRYFTQDEERQISQADRALTLYMVVKDKPLESVHLQIKILYALVPNMLGIYAESQECLLNKREVAMAAKSKVGLRPMDLYRVQAVQDSDGDIWLHTHGLMPLGMTELEILGVDEENADIMCSLINAVASQMTDNHYGEEERQTTLFIGNCSDGDPIVATIVPWVHGIEEYKQDNVQGLEEDRVDSHNKYTSLIFLYKNEDAYNNGILTKPMELVDKIGENPLFLYGTKTTEIMATLAQERVSYVERALKLKESDKDEQINIIAKIAVDVIDDEGEKTVEHVWFEIDSISRKEISGILTQELFFDGGILKGERGTYPLSKITDWSIAYKGVYIDSRFAYLLDMLQEEV